uniref:Uncharacterized protein n=1 Tax=Talaromyces marneffei PM1 TaxID=1077442 RepID=A0A093UZ79_TALMA
MDYLVMSLGSPAISSKDRCRQGVTCILPRRALGEYDYA